MLHRKHIAFTHKSVCTNIRTHTCEQIVPERNPRSQDTPLRPRTLHARVPYIVLHTVHGDVAYDGDSAGGDVNTYTYSYMHVYVYVYIYMGLSFYIHTCIHPDLHTYSICVCMTLRGNFLLLVLHTPHGYGGSAGDGDGVCLI